MAALLAQHRPTRTSEQRPHRLLSETPSIEAKNSYDAVPRARTERQSDSKQRRKLAMISPSGCERVRSVGHLKRHNSQDVLHAHSNESKPWRNGIGLESVCARRGPMGDRGVVSLAKSNPATACAPIQRFFSGLAIFQTNRPPGSRDFFKEFKVRCPAIVSRPSKRDIYFHLIGFRASALPKKCREIQGGGGGVALHPKQ